MVTIYLIRHGTTESNAKGIFQGQLDIPLNERGRAQADCLARRFENVPLDAVYSSPLSRAYETAEYVGRSHGLTPVAVPELSEINGGLMQGKDGDTNRRLYPEQIYYMSYEPAKFCAPGGETSRQLYDRMIRAVGSIAAENQGKNVAVVTHGFAIQMFMSYVEGDAFEDTAYRIVGNASVTTVTYDDALNVRLERFNDESHIPENLRFEFLKGFA